jgi:two-component system sensor histidine kinase BaeS
VTDSVDSVQLDVLDTVPGVPDEALSRLFNRLYRVDQSRSRGLGGSGLGLAICQQIVLAHNGTITAKHAPQGGLWIQTVLPKAQEEL